MLGLCELFVARGLTKKTVFGKIWKYLEGRAILTPQGYEHILVHALKSPYGFVYELISVRTHPFPDEKNGHSDEMYFLHSLPDGTLPIESCPLIARS